MMIKMKNKNKIKNIKIIIILKNPLHTQRNNFNNKNKFKKCKLIRKKMKITKEINKRKRKV